MDAVVWMAALVQIYICRSADFTSRSLCPLTPRCPPTVVPASLAIPTSHGFLFLAAFRISAAQGGSSCLFSLRRLSRTLCALRAPATAGRLDGEYRASTSEPASRANAIARVKHAARSNSVPPGYSTAFQP